MNTDMSTEESTTAPLLKPPGALDFVVPEPSK